MKMKLNELRKLIREELQSVILQHSFYRYNKKMDEHKKNVGKVRNNDIKQPDQK